MVADVDVTSDLPHIRIEANAVRSLKTDASRRVVPLVGNALTAAKEAHERASASAEGGYSTVPSVWPSTRL